MFHAFITPNINELTYINAACFFERIFIENTVFKILMYKKNVLYKNSFIFSTYSSKYWRKN